jgi:hypothetical protein
MQVGVKLPPGTSPSSLAQSRVLRSALSSAALSGSGAEALQAAAADWTVVRADAVPLAAAAAEAVEEEVLENERQLPFKGWCPPSMPLDPKRCAPGCPVASVSSLHERDDFLTVVNFFFCLAHARSNSMEAIKRATTLSRFDQSRVVNSRTLSGVQVQPEAKRRHV